MFNTLKYAKILEEAGFSRTQAEASVRILVETMEDKLASKQDLKDLEVKLSGSINALDVKIQQAESRMTIRMGTMLAATIAILTAIQAYMLKFLTLHS